MGYRIGFRRTAFSGFEACLAVGLADPSSMVDAAPSVPASSPSAGVLSIEASIDSSEVSEDGSFLVRWGFPSAAEDRGAVRYQLDAKFPGQPSFEAVYSGADEQSFFSGIPNGKTQFRVRAEVHQLWSAWSEPISVTVAHHPWPKSFGLPDVGRGCLCFHSFIHLVRCLA